MATKINNNNILEGKKKPQKKNILKNKSLQSNHKLL